MKVFLVGIVIARALSATPKDAIGSPVTAYPFVGSSLLPDLERPICFNILLFHPGDDLLPVRVFEELLLAVDDPLRLAGLVAPFGGLRLNRLAITSKSPVVTLGLLFGGNFQCFYHN